MERCLRYAFELTKKRNKANKLTLCGKTNVLTFEFDLWERAFHEVAKEYPMVQTDYAHVDATTLWMVKNPEGFDVAVTGNMMGDIITDLGAAISGGLGIAASGNLNPGKVSMFEAIHGSAPKHAGKGVICPLSTINAVAMMVDYLGYEKSATRIETAMSKALTSGEIKSLYTSSGMRTSEYTDVVLKYLN